MGSAAVQRRNKLRRKGQRMAPYCITMLLTPDYGETAKGKPEAPKAQTPHHCTGQSRASSSVTAPNWYKIPHLSTEDPCTQGPGLQTALGERRAHRPNRPQGLGVTRACRQGSPYSKHDVANTTANFGVRLPGRHSPMSGGDRPQPVAL